MDLRTDLQKTREERDKEICETYMSIRKSQPYASKNRVLIAVAKEYGIVGQTVKVILTKNNCYV